MKKVLSLVVLSISVFMLVGCQSKLGELPEVKESQKVEMTAQEMNQLLSSVNMMEQINESMMLSLDIDLEFTNAVFDWMDYYNTEKIGDENGSLKLSSTTYISLSDQIDEVLLHSVNNIDLLVETIYLDEETVNEKTELKGDLNVYFTDQYLYYDVDLVGLEDETMFENGQYKLNFGITQSMWDEIYQSPEGVADNFLDIELNPEDLLANLEVISLMLETDMLAVYQSGSTYTFMLDINKEKILENIDAVIEIFMDSEEYTDEEYESFKADFEETLSYFTKLEVLLGVVVEDNLVTKIGIDMSIDYNDDETSFRLIGKLVFDMAIDMPNLPSDLDEYELSELDMGF